MPANLTFDYQLHSVHLRMESFRGEACVHGFIMPLQKLVHSEPSHIQFSVMTGPEEDRAHRIHTTGTVRMNDEESDQEKTQARLLMLRWDMSSAISKTLTQLYADEFQPEAISWLSNSSSGVLSDLSFAVALALAPILDGEDRLAVFLQKPEIQERLMMDLEAASQGCDRPSVPAFAYACRARGLSQGEGVDRVPSLIRAVHKIASATAA